MNEGLAKAYELRRQCILAAKSGAPVPDAPESVRAYANYWYRLACLS